MGDDFKEVPRWAVGDAIKKVVGYQQKNGPSEAIKIFGKLKPKYVGDNFIISKIFSKGEDARSYMDERGSSANWND